MMLFFTFILDFKGDMNDIDTLVLDNSKFYFVFFRDGWSLDHA